jgi:YHS domain-containing protein
MVGKMIVPLGFVAMMTMVGCTQNDGMSGMHMDHHDHADAASATIPAGAIDLGNTVCPVTGDKVGDSKVIAVYEGKVYHFCCSDCPKDFNKDPAKFAKLVAADPAKYGVKRGN